MQAPLTKVSVLEKLCKQCQLLWTAKTGQKRHKEQTQGSSVESSHLELWQSKASHSSPNGADYLQPGLGTAPSSPLQPRPCPFNFHLFGPLKDFTRVTKFESEDEEKSVVSDWLRHQSKDFYAQGIRKLVHKWKKCVKLMGDYAKKKKKLSFYLNYNFLYRKIRLIYWMTLVNWFLFSISQHTSWINASITKYLPVGHCCVEVIVRNIL